MQILRRISDANQDGSESPGGPALFAYEEWSPVVSYIDTVEVYIKYKHLPRGFLAKLFRTAHGSHLPPIYLPYGVILKINQPSQDTLLLFKGVKASLRRLHVAFDFDVCLYEYLKQHLVLKYRRQGFLLFWKTTVYWQVYLNGKARPTNIALYPDKLSKVTQKPCAHLEIRFETSRRCRGLQKWLKETLQLANIGELTDLNPKQLFDRCMKIIDFDAQKHVNGIVKNTIRHEHELYQKKERRRSAFTDKYRNDLAAYTARKIAHFGYDCAQIIKDEQPERFKRMEVLSSDVLRLPVALSWAVHAKSTTVDNIEQFFQITPNVYTLSQGDVM